MEKSGRAAFEFLRAHGADVTATDIRTLRVPGFACKPTNCSPKRGI